MSTDIQEVKMRDIVPKFIDGYEDLYQRLNQQLQSFSSSSEDLSRINFIHNLRNDRILADVKQNLEQLRDVSSLFPPCI